MRVGNQRHAPAILLSGKGFGTHCTVGWLGSRADVEWCRKPRPLRVTIPGPYGVCLVAVPVTLSSFCHYTGCNWTALQTYRPYRGGNKKGSLRNGRCDRRVLLSNTIGARIWCVDAMSATQSMSATSNSSFNPLNTKRRLLYLKTPVRTAQ